jgi:charged multivesicular body protein 2A
MKGHMVGLSQQLQTVQSTSKIQETMAITARMLQGLNARFDAASVARMLAEFEKQNILMTNKQEVVEDTLDCTFEVDGEHDATNDAVASVLQEVGLDVQSKFKAQAGVEAWKNTQEEDDMAERLQRLRPRD